MRMKKFARMQLVRWRRVLQFDLRMKNYRLIIFFCLSSCSSNNVARHTEGSNYLMADCHAKFFRPGAVSGGSVAFAEDCNQEGNPALPDCGAQNGMAAGTGNSKYAVTFSTR